jgi:hypothetical protein
VLLHLGGAADRPRQDQVAEAGREPLNLRLDPVGHVHGQPDGAFAGIGCPG